MRISASTRVKLEQARKLFAQNGNLSKTSRELGIHRSTLDRWQREGLLAPEAEAVEPVGFSLDGMVNKAIKVLDSALEGEKVTPNQIRAALEVVKASNALRAQAKAEEAKASLAELIAQEDTLDSD